jgi:hypothetical protein
MNKSLHYLITGLATLAFMLAGLEGQAAPRPGDVGYGDPWKAAPYSFDFGNHIDTHIQLKLITNKAGDPNKLIGSFYIIFTDDQGVSLGIDPDSGLPIARHPRGYKEKEDGSVEHDEQCGVSPNITCEVGWWMDGHPGNAKFVSHSGVNGDDHPVWLTNRSPGSNPDSGMSIPQPGSFTHFHWITPSGDDPRAVPAACDEQMAGKLEGTVIEEADVDVDGVIKVKDLPDVPATAGWTGQKVHSGLAETESPDDSSTASAEDVVCPGWYLQINARTNFAFQHGGEIIPIHSGIDNTSHLNLLLNYGLVPGLTPTRGCGGDGGGGNGCGGGH